MLGKYAKTIVAAIGVILAGLNEVFGVSLGVDAQQVFSFVIPILTVAGVYQVPNTPAA
jgi:uncharacterized membrane protein